MAAVLAAPSYSRIGFSLYFAVRARRVRVPGGSKFHLEPGTIYVFPWQYPNFLRGNMVVASSPLSKEGKNPTLKRHAVFAPYYHYLF